MNKYTVRVLVSLSTVVEVEAKSKEDAIAKATKEYDSGKLMGEPWSYEYYDGMDIDIEDIKE